MEPAGHQKQVRTGLTAGTRSDWLLELGLELERGALGADARQDGNEIEFLSREVFSGGCCRFDRQADRAWPSPEARRVATGSGQPKATLIWRNFGMRRSRGKASNAPLI